MSLDSKGWYFKATDTEKFANHVYTILSDLEGNLPRQQKENVRLL